MATIAELRSRSETLFTDLLRAHTIPPSPARAQRRRGVAARPAIPADPGPSPFNWFDPAQAIAATTMALRLAALAASKKRVNDGLGLALDHAEAERARVAPEQVRQGLALFVTHDQRGRRLIKPRAVVAAPTLFPRSPRAVARRHGVSIGGAAPQLDYWREDALANEHHQHWHEVYPYSGLPPSDFTNWVTTTPKTTLVQILTALDSTRNWTQILNGLTTERIAGLFADVAGSDAVSLLPADLYRKLFRLNDRQGELFFYMHAQMLARYDAELLSNGLQRVKPFGPPEWPQPIPEGHNPIGLAGFFRRNANVRLSAGAVSALTTRENEILQALTAKKLRGVGVATLAIDRTRLGEAVESTVAQLRDTDPGRYGGLHNAGHGFIAQLSAGGPGVMTSTVTAIRDQVFWRWHKHIDDLNSKWQDTLAPYPFTDAPAVIMRNDLTAANAGPWSSPDIILCRTADLPTTGDLRVLGEQLFGGPKWGADFTAATATAPGQTLTTVSELRTAMATRTVAGAPVTYLTHTPFSYFLRIENKATTKRTITVRIFLAPAESAADRRAWIEMDKFLAEIPARKKVVLYRSDTESAIVKRPAEMNPGTVQPGGGNPNENAYCDCGWPYTLLLPRGTASGMSYRLMVICTDAAIDKVAAPDHCGSMSYCGAVDRYPDTRDMGYPFSRPFGAGPSALLDALVALPSASARTVTIRHG